MLAYYHIALGGTIFVAGLIMAAVLSIRGGSPAHRFLALLTLSAAYCSTVLIFHLTGELPSHSPLLVFLEPVRLAWGPMVYFYVRWLTEPRFSFRPVHWLAFLPSGVSLGMTIGSFLTGTGPSGITLFAEPRLSDMLCLTYSAVSLALALRRFLAFEAYAHEVCASCLPPKLAFLRYLLFMVCLVWLVSAAHRTVARNDQTREVMVVLLSVFVYGVGFFSLRYSRLLQEIPTLPEIMGPRYGTSSLSSEDVAALTRQLLAYMEAEKPHLRADLKLADLAASLGIKPHQMSQVINVGLGQNFYELVNRYRIEEAKLRLIAPDASDQKILGIALDTGFQSKSAFNAAFKRFTGLTPSQFQNAKLASSSA